MFDSEDKPKNDSDETADEVKKPAVSKARIKLSILFLVLVLVPFFVFFAYSSNLYIESLEEQIIDDMTMVAEVEEGILLTYLNSLKSRSIDFSSDGLILNATEALVQDPTNQELFSSLEYHLINRKLSLDETLKLINITDRNGVVINSTDKREVGSNRSDTEYFIKTKGLPNGYAYISDLVDTEQFDNDKSIIVSSPLISRETGENIGIIVLHFTHEVIDRLFSGEQQIFFGAQTGSRGREKSLEIYLVNNDGLMISRSLVLGDDGFLTQEVDTEPVNLCKISRQELSGVWQNYLGETVIGASMCLTNYHDWVLLVEVSRDEVLSSAYSLQKTMINIGILTAILLSFIALFAAQLITRRE